MSQLSFLAIDFETANPDQASVCQVGVAKVVEGAIVATDSWLVKPPTGVNSFEPRFIGIHGITPKQVARSGISWQESLERIVQLAEGLPLVAHNVSFDRTVFRRACQRAGIPVPQTQWFDTLVLARRFVTAQNHRLPTVAKALKLPAFRHHQAEADAVTSARIALELSQRHQLLSVSELWERPSVSRRSKVPARRFVRVGDLPTPNGDADPAHPLHGHHVVITGDLDGISRDDFIVKVAALGAQPQLNVTKKTTMLVVATHESFPVHYDPTLGTAKEKKADEYRLAGQEIEFVAAQQALTMLATAVEEQVAPASEVSDKVPELSVRESSAKARPTRQPETTPTAIPKVAARQRKKVSAQLVRPLAWCLIGFSALMVFLFLLGVTGAAFTDDSGFSIIIWLVTMLLGAPFLGAPGLLGWYLLKRYPKGP